MSEENVGGHAILRNGCLVVRNTNHYVGGLDHGPAVDALTEPELLDRFDGDLCDQTLPIDIEFDVSDRLAPRDLGNRGRKLVASTKLH